jgi:hypothetical protein
MSLRYRLIPDILIERFEDQSLVFLVGSGQWVRLNGPATEVLLSIHASCAGPVTAEGLASLLTGRYDLDASYAVEAASNLLDEWSRVGIVCPVREEHQEWCRNP